MIKEAKKDIFYKHIKDPLLLEKAGWFYDGLTAKKRKGLYALDIFTTPIHKLKEKENPVVLISTGGFSPLHKGHLNMMEKAKKVLEAAGYGVCGGYFSPSHDSYVLKKENTNSLDLRAKSIEDKIFNSSWLMTDLWEGMYTPTAINFTDVVLRLEEYLKKWVNPKIRVCYCFGSDNQFFIEAFRYQGMAVCINRETELNQKLKEIVDNKRVFFVNNKEYSKIKSRKINYKYEKSNSGSFLVRDDLKEALGEDSSEVLKIFNKYFKDIKIVPKEYNIKFSEKAISLDTWYKGDYNLGISRYFSLSDFNLKGNFLGKRIGSDNLSTQIKKISKGQYILVDDDIASGQTMSWVKNILKENDIQILKEESLVNKYLKVDEIYDIVDLRDFFFGAKNGGLTITLPNKKSARVPYILPFVSLFSRASLNYTKGICFSRDILILNLKYVGEKKVEDLPESQQELFLFLGYRKNSKMKQFIRDQINFLENIYN